ncbi:MAG: hypothetical protein HZB46_12110 [Solirubrobacterales bacterium]|nr:hypothetical protein [Solirubrobacterales bacterium]
MTARPIARSLLAAFALALLAPLPASAAAAPAAGDHATCPPGSELRQRTRRVRHKGRRVVRLVRRWACVEDRTAPGRVTGLSAQPGDGQVVLTWKASEDRGGIAGYEIHRDGRYVVTIASTTFTDPQLQNGVAHQYRVYAVDMARNLSAPSGVVWALPRAVPDRTPPGMPVGLTATADASALAVTLRWTAPADDKGVVGYRVYRDGALAGTSTTPSFTDAERSHRTEYRYAVVALDAAGNVSPATPAVATYVS